MEYKVQTHLPLQLHPSVDPCMLCAPFAMSSLCVLGLDAHPSQSTISLLTKLQINTHYPHTILLPEINYISFKIYFWNLLVAPYRHFDT